MLRLLLDAFTVILLAAFGLGRLRPARAYPGQVARRALAFDALPSRN